MILGLDLRAGVCGWSLLDEVSSSFVSVGVQTLGHPRSFADATIARVDRAHGLAQVVAAQAKDCTAIVVERWVPELVPELEVGLAWGSVLGVVATLDPRPRLVTLDPQRWKREVLLGKRTANDEVAYATAAYVLRGHPRADAALRRLPMREREPAVAAAMVALYGWLQMSKSRRGAAA